jgi:[ribosomal protein S18]-alanine N-acetyltransferase
MSIQIRRMSAGDIDAVVALEQQIPEAPPWRRADYEQCLSTETVALLTRAAFIAESEAGLLGFIVVKLIAGVVELESIVVAASASEQGIGRELLQTALAWAQERGANRLELEVRASNHRAISFYERAGLRCEGVRPGYYQSPVEDALLMSMDLQNGGKLL